MWLVIIKVKPSTLKLCHFNQSQTCRLTGGGGNVDHNFNITIKSQTPDGEDNTRLFIVYIISITILSGILQS